jgi:hypothetical protein
MREWVRCIKARRALKELAGAFRQTGNNTAIAGKLHALEQFNRALAELSAAKIDYGRRSRPMSRHDVNIRQKRWIAESAVRHDFSRVAIRKG